MRIAFARLAFLGISLIGVDAAHGQAFTDRAAFEAALGAFSVETFESAPLSGSGSSGGVASISFDDFKVDTVPPAAKVLNFTHFGAFNTTPGGANYLYLDSDVGFVGVATTITPNNPVHAIGFDYTSIVVASSTNTVTVQGQAFTLALSTSTQHRFFGYISTNGQALADLTVSTSTNSAYGIDQLTLGAPCSSPSSPYGVGCPGPGGFVPKVATSSCAELGQPFTLTIDDALGGALAVFFVGTGPTSIPLSNGCSFLVSPLLPPLFSLPLGGAGPGGGFTILASTIPLSAPVGVVVHLQALIDHGDGTFSASNGARIPIQ